VRRNGDRFGKTGHFVKKLPIFSKNWPFLVKNCQFSQKTRHFLEKWSIFAVISSFGSD